MTITITINITINMNITLNSKNNHKNNNPRTLTLITHSYYSLLDYFSKSKT